MLKQKKETIDLSVIIPTKNRKNDLMECLESLFMQDCHPKEIIIVDQSTKAVSSGEFKEVIPALTELVYIHDVRITGATQARNLALDRAQGKMILLLDDDIILSKNSLKEVLDIFSKDSSLNISGVGGSAINETPTLFHVIGVKLFCHGPFAFWKDQITFDWKAKRGNSVFLKSKIIPAGASCVKREVFKKFRFDENLVGYTYGDDSIFGYQASSEYNFFLYSGFKFFHKKLSGAIKNKRIHIKRQIIWWFYFFSRYVDKTAFNTLCFSWSIIGILGKILIHFYDLELLRGAFAGFKIIVTLANKKIPIEVFIKSGAIK